MTSGSFERSPIDGRPWLGAPMSRLEALARNTLRPLLAILILLAVWVSTKPFYSVEPIDGAPAGGDLVNQVTFAGLAALSAIMLLYADRKALSPLAQLSYLLLAGWIVLCVIGSTEFAISMRAFQFAIVIIFLAAATLVLPLDERQFGTVLAIAVGFVVALAWAGVIALPGQAKHTDFDPFEPEHAGSWRGHFDHKNVAGGMMAVFTFCGVYLMRSGRPAIGGMIAAAAFVFLYFTKSKTSLALTPAVIMVAFLMEFFRSRSIRLLLGVGAILTMVTVTLGSVVFKPVDDLVQWLVPGTNFTGRVDIWKYGFEKLAERPWTGFGFEAFWLTPTTLFGESRQELAWSVDKIVHGHNGYLDVALTMGLPGLALVAYVFMLKPMIDYHRAGKDAARQPLASLFIMIWLFAGLNLCLESYFFRRSDPVWFSLLIAVLGLRFLAGGGEFRRRPAS
jgi:O-antigen ligase